MARKSPFELLNQRIIDCNRCPRLREHCENVAIEKRAAYRDETYFGKPVPNLGRAGARLLIVGLAPGAHGANRTGRMFTGDRSGDFLFKVMHRAGFCNQPQCTDVDDGLEMIDAAITAAAHCAPPGNKPTTDELANCVEWFDKTFDVMKDIRVIVNLGKIAHDAVLKYYRRRGLIKKLADYRFGHGVEHQIPDAPPLICCFHPSQQNTFTGRLTEDMMFEIFDRARQLIEQ